MSSLGPAIFFCTVIIAILILYERKKGERIQEAEQAKFWSREAQSNYVRKKDISTLDYIKIPLDQLPIMDTDDMELLEYQGIIEALSTQCVLNLTGISNTDLKYEYGPANLAALSEYDSNYSTLVNILAKWGKRLYELDLTDQAIAVLEYGISIKTDVSRNYILLAELYIQKGQSQEIDRLLNAAESIHSLMKSSIIRTLNELKSELT